MVFSSSVFVFLFLPLTLFATFIFRSVSWQNAILLFASLFLYTWGETVYVVVLLISIGANYLFGLGVDHFSERPKMAKMMVAGAVTVNLMILGFFKYASFAVANINNLLTRFEFTPISFEYNHLPLGISFFTFQAISYIVDIYRKEAKVQRNFLSVALYISMFPQLIAGPIVRYRDIATRLVERSVSLKGFSEGVERFIIGLGKKMLLANPLGGIADSIFALPGQALTFPLAWAGTVAYTFQIYFDFSGYSDMAIGLGKMFGFRFPENFNYPYISKSIKEFWRRWHISLSSWFRDYLYIPLGGNKKGPTRTYMNLLTVFFLCGLWHGASWNFVVWGLYHGLFLVAERGRFGALLSTIPTAGRHAYAIIIITVGWVFFRAETLPMAISFLTAMAGFGSGDGAEFHVGLYVTPTDLLYFAAALIASTPVWRSLKLVHRRPRLARKGGVALRGAILGANYGYLLTIFLLCAMNLAAGAYNPFIYFRF